MNMHGMGLVLGCVTCRVCLQKGQLVRPRELNPEANTPKSLNNGALDSLDQTLNPQL